MIFLLVFSSLPFFYGLSFFIPNEKMFFLRPFHSKSNRFLVINKYVVVVLANGNVIKMCSCSSLNKIGLLCHRHWHMDIKETCPIYDDNNISIQTQTLNVRINKWIIESVNRFIFFWPPESSFRALHNENERLTTDNRQRIHKVTLEGATK